MQLLSTAPARQIKAMHVMHVYPPSKPTPCWSELMIGSSIMVSGLSPKSIPVVTASSGSSSEGVIKSSIRSRNNTGTLHSKPGCKFLSQSQPQPASESESS